MLLPGNFPGLDGGAAAALRNQSRGKQGCSTVLNGDLQIPGGFQLLQPVQAQPILSCK